MNTVFIGGSRHVSRLPSEVKKRLDNVVASGHRVIVGDANGADKAVQKHFTTYTTTRSQCSAQAKPRATTSEPGSPITSTRQSTRRAFSSTRPRTERWRVRPT